VEITHAWVIDSQKPDEVFQAPSSLLIFVWCATKSLRKQAAKDVVMVLGIWQVN